MSICIPIGRGEIQIGWRYGKKDQYLPVFEQLVIRVISGKRFIEISNFEPKELEEFPRKLENALNEFFEREGVSLEKEMIDEKERTLITEEIERKGVISPEHYGKF